MTMRGMNTTLTPTAPLRRRRALVHTATRLAFAVALALALGGCTTLVPGAGDDAEAAAAIRDEILRNTPPGTPRVEVIALLRENRFRMELRTGEPFAKIAGEYLYAIRVKRVTYHTWRHYQVAITLADDKLAAVQVRSNLVADPLVERGSSP